MDPITITDFNNLISAVELLQHTVILVGGILSGLLVAIIIALGVKG